MNIKYKLHLTQEFVQNSRDEYVEKLEREKGEDAAYIGELQEDREKMEQQLEQKEIEKIQLEEELEELKEKYQKILDIFSKGINEYIQSDEYIKKYKDKIEELRTERDYYRAQRDALITRLSQNQNV